MKFVVVAAVAALLVSVPAWGSFSQSPNPTRVKSVVRISVTTADVRETRDLRTDILLLWNRNERSTPIGHAVKSCVKIGNGGILGHGGVLSCQMTLSLPLGKVAAQGIVHNLYRYTMVVTGGTGVYEGASGPLFVRRGGEGVRQMTFKV